MIKTKVYKFGGSLISGASDFRNIANIIKAQSPEVVVISATKGTTNLLEKIAMNSYQGRLDEAQALITEFQKKHLNIMLELKVLDGLKEDFEKLISELISLAGETPKTLIGSTFDRILSIGERTSSLILASLLDEHDLLDATSIISTNDNYSNATVDFDKTKNHIDEIIRPQLDQGKKFITQGFLGKEAGGNITTLGREGSDYSASIFGGLLSASSVTIYTDVAGVFESDPKKYEWVRPISHLSYLQAELMAENGAKVLYPKTLKPLKTEKVELIVTNLEQSTQTQISEGHPIQKAFVCKGNRMTFFCDESFVDETFLQKVSTLGVLVKKEGFYLLHGENDFTSNQIQELLFSNN